MSGNLAPAKAKQEGCLALCAAGGYAQFQAIGTIALGRVVAQLGRTEEGLQLIREGLALQHETGNRAAITQYLTWLAATLREGDFLAEAMTAADEALGANRDEKIYRPGALIVRAQINETLDRREAAEADLATARKLATTMGAQFYLVQLETLFP